MKKHRKIVNTVINNLPEIDEWECRSFKKTQFKSWNDQLKIHYSEKIGI